jgi:hypothetical protein
MANERRNAADYAAAGGVLLGASAAADGAVAWDRKKRGMDGPVRAAVKRKFTRRHAGQVGVKLAGRGAFAAGLPLAAYGGYKMARPDGPVPKMDAKRDVVKPVTRGIALKDVVEQQERRFAKQDLTQKETKVLVSRKKRGQHISAAAGVMGLGALALRAPEAAKFATKRSVKAGKNATLKRLAAKEPGSTKASNALGIVSIGTGAAGSLNYAAQQNLEAKAIKKTLGEAMHRSAKVGRLRVLSSPKKDYFDVLDNRDTRRFVHRSNLVFVKPKGKKKPVKVDKPSPVQSPTQMELPFGKADDRFLRQYKERISPEAERGYKYLKRGRNVRVADAAVSSGFAGLSGGLGAHALRRGSKGWAAVGAAGAGLSGISALRSGNEAHRWNSKMGKIKAKAKERAAAGQYGRGREVGKSAGKKAEGAAQATAGGAALGLGLSTNRLMNGAEGRWDKKINARYDRMMSSVPLGETKEQKKQRGGAVSRINQERNGELKKNPYKKITGAKGRGRAALLTAGFATGVPNIWLGSRKAVEKADKHDVDAFMAGALAGAGAYHGGLYATKRVDRKLAARVKAGPDFQATERAHRKTHGLKGNPRIGDARWKAYHRTYPKSTTLPKGAEGPTRPMPGARWKRSLSRLQAGKTQVAITAGVAGATGLAGAKLNRKVHPVDERKVQKSFRFGAGRLVPRAPRMRKPAIRRSYIARSASGKPFSVRGSLK